MDYEFDPIPLFPTPATARALSPTDSQREADNYVKKISSRRSVRDFKDTPVSRSVIESCLRAAGTAPSGANQQPWHFVCISDPATKRAIREAAEKEERAFYDGKAGEAWLNDLKKMGTNANKPFLEEAPWLIAIFLERYGADENGDKQKNYYTSESVGIATGFLINALHFAGLATLTHTPSPMKFLNLVLGRPNNERPFILLVVGYPKDDAMVPRAATTKKPLSAIASFVEAAGEHCGTPSHDVDHVISACEPESGGETER